MSKTIVIEGQLTTTVDRLYCLKGIPLSTGYWTLDIRINSVTLLFLHKRSGTANVVDKLMCTLSKENKYIIIIIINTYNSKELKSGQ